MMRSIRLANFYRSQPKKDFSEKHGSFASFSFGANSMTGWRLSQEDRCICLPSPDFTGTNSFFAIYDGHGGEEVAEFLKLYLHRHILQSLKELDHVKFAIIAAFKSCDARLKNLKPKEYREIKKATNKKFDIYDTESTSESANVSSEEFMYEVKNEVHKQVIKMQTDFAKFFGTASAEQSGTSGAKKKEKNKTEKPSCSTSKDPKPVYTLPPPMSIEEEARLVGHCCGSTATVVVFTDKMIYVANVGDSRCIASVDGTVKILSHDHRPSDPREHERILESGHTISRGRINGGLNMSRAFGDFAFKSKSVSEDLQAIIVIPTITSIEINAELDFVIIASDGVWNNMESEEVVAFVSKNIDLPLQEICVKIFEHILSKSKTHFGKDNMTMIIIKNELKKKNVEKIKTKATEFMEMETIEMEIPEMQFKEETEMKEMGTKKMETKVAEAKAETKEIDSKGMVVKKTVVKNKDFKKPEIRKVKRLKK